MHAKSSAAEKKMMSGERTAIEREMFIAAVRETVFGFLIDPALTWRWIAGGMAFLRSSHKKGGKSHDSQGIRNVHQPGGAPVRHEYESSTYGCVGTVVWCLERMVDLLHRAAARNARGSGVIPPIARSECRCLRETAPSKP